MGVRSADVVIGGIYACYSIPDEPCVAMGVTRDRFDRPRLEMRNPAGEIMLVDSRYVKPWSEFMLECELEAGEMRDMVSLAERLTGGVGRIEAEEAYSNVYHLRFDESAAEALLTGLGGKPLADRCRPSQAETHGEFRDARLSLARRVRRALGVGCASAWGMQRLDQNGFDCQIEISHDQLLEAVERLDPEGSASSLADLLT